jgi:outer membrane protein assembly factor BamC
MLHLLKLALWGLFITVIVGCSSTSENRADYKKSTTAPSLELPPDLIGSTKIDEQLVVPEMSDSTTFSDYDKTEIAKQTPAPSSGTHVLPIFEKVQLQRDGKTRWLVIKDEPNKLWSKLKQFWQAEGFKLKIENPKFGVMETEWAENRADIPQQGLRKLLGTVFDMLHSAPTRDKFRIRLERGKVEGFTEVYLTHRGVEEVAQDQDIVWHHRPSDPELEAEMLTRLMVFLGLDQKQAETLLALPKKEETSVPRAQLTSIEEGMVKLIVDEDFARTWRRTGLALDKLGFTVEDRDRSRGLYFIRYIDPDIEKDKPGFFAGWFGGDKPSSNEQYRINVRDELSETHIVILNKEEQMDTSQTAVKILALLQEQLK